MQQVFKRPAVLDAWKQQCQSTAVSKRTKKLVVKTCTNCKANDSATTAKLPGQNTALTDTLDQFAHPSNLNAVLGQLSLAYLQGC